MSRFRRGFTLLEMVAVLVLLVVLTGAAAYSLQGHLRVAQLDTTLGRMASLDSQARDAARRHRTFLRLIIDAEDRSLTLESDAESTPVKTFRLPRGLEISGLRNARTGNTDGRLQIPVSPLGQSDSYAVEVAAAEGRRMWFVVLGGSGQVVRISNEQEVIQLLRPTRTNAG